MISMCRALRLPELYSPFSPFSTPDLRPLRIREATVSGLAAFFELHSSPSPTPLRLFLAPLTSTRHLRFFRASNPSPQSGGGVGGGGASNVTSTAVHLSSLLPPPMANLTHLPASLWLHQRLNESIPESAKAFLSSSLQDLPSLFVTLACISLSLTLLLRSRSSRRLRSRYPPGPRPWPILGNIPTIGSLPHRSLAKLADRFGPILTVWFGPTPCVVISSPTLAKEALMVEDKLCSGRPLTITTRFLTLGGKDVAFAPPEGAWKARRRLVFLHLMSARQLAGSCEQREREVKAMVAGMAEEVRGVAPSGDNGGGGDASATSTAAVVNMRNYLTRVTLNDVLRLTVGKRYPYIFPGTAQSTTCGATTHPASAAAAAAAGAGVTGGSSPAAEQEAEEQEGERVSAMVDEVAAVIGAFNLSDHLPWLQWLDPQGIDKRVKVLKPAVYGYILEAFTERKRTLERQKRVKARLDGQGGAEEEEEQQRGKDGGVLDGELPAGKVFVDYLLEKQRGGGGEAGDSLAGSGGAGAGGAAGGGEDSLDEEEMVMLVVDMIIAGTDTTAKAVEWALAELANHPRALAQLREELDAAYSAAAATATPAAAADAEAAIRPAAAVAADSGKGNTSGGLALHKLPFLQAVIKETLRHHPVLPLLVPHMTTGPVVLGGHSVPGGTMLLVNAWAISHDPETWPDPHEFNPWRFMPSLTASPPALSTALSTPCTVLAASSPASTAAPAPAPAHPPAPSYSTAPTPVSWDPSSTFHMLPFGAGRRGCVGMALGVDTAARMLAAIVLCFHMAVPTAAAAPAAAATEGAEGRQYVGMEEELGLTMAMAKPLELLLWERENGEVGRVL